MRTESGKPLRCGSSVSGEHTPASSKPHRPLDLWGHCRRSIPPPDIEPPWQEMVQSVIWMLISLVLLLVLWPLSCATLGWSADLRPEEIVTVLPKDAIPAILSPKFDEGRKASWLRANDFVVGVEVSGDSRAYPVPTLSRHEIINDKVGGIPIAVTW